MPAVPCVRGRERSHGVPGAAGALTPLQSVNKAQLPEPRALPAALGAIGNLLVLFYCPEPGRAGGGCWEPQRGPTLTQRYFSLAGVAVAWKDPVARAVLAWRGSLGTGAMARPGPGTAPLSRHSKEREAAPEEPGQPRHGELRSPGEKCHGGTAESEPTQGCARWGAPK